MITKALVARMVKEVGAMRADGACWDAGLDLHPSILEFVKKAPPLALREVTDALVQGCAPSVLELDWDSGAIGANGTESIRKLGGQYWHYSDHSEYVSEPYGSLRKALVGAEFNVNGATERVRTRELTSEQLAAALPVLEDTPVGHVVRLNRQAWMVGADLALTRKHTTKH
jgi:hypothetical protein